MHCEDLGESFPTSIFLQYFVSIQPRTSPVKFAASSDKRFAALASGARRARPAAAGRPRPAGPVDACVVTTSGKLEEYIFWTICFFLGGNEDEASQRKRSKTRRKSFVFPGVVTPQVATTAGTLPPRSHIIFYRRISNERSSRRSS